MIQIPAYNEVETLANTYAELPRELPGVTKIETLLIDDGSHDGTAELGRSLGFTHVLSLPRHLGLARAFAEGVQFAMKQEIDWLVNTDADNQYRGSEIAALIRPLAEDKADFVIGDRQIRHLGYLSPLQKWLHRIAALVISPLLGESIPDPASGFRALNRRAMAAMRLQDGYTYTLESLFAVREAGLRMDFVPIHPRPVQRPSRLIKNPLQYLFQSAKCLLRSVWIYRLKPFISGSGLIPSALLPERAGPRAHTLSPYDKECGG